MRRCRIWSRDTITEKLGSQSIVGSIAGDLESWVMCCDRQD
jgi:hypothetical protein